MTPEAQKAIENRKESLSRIIDREIMLCDDAEQSVNLAYLMIIRAKVILEQYSKSKTQGNVLLDFLKKESL